VNDDLVSLSVVYAKGLCMGMADAVPGVSGGTVALVLGIYDRLVSAISELSVENALVVLRGLRHPRSIRRNEEVRAAIDRIELPFLLALGTGMVTGVVVLSRVVTWANEANPAALFAFFVGLIGASSIVLVREVRPFDRTEAIALIGGIVVAALASQETTIGSGHPLPLLFFAGVIAFSAMVMPGLSGSLLLVVLGQYTYLSETLTEFTNQLAGLATGDETTVPVAEGTVIVVFIAGGAVGIMTVARLVNAALERNRSVTLAFLVGLVLGALRAPSARVDEHVGSWTPEATAVVAASLLAGAAFVLLIDRYLYRIEL